MSPREILWVPQKFNASCHFCQSAAFNLNWLLYGSVHATPWPFFVFTYCMFLFYFFFNSFYYVLFPLFYLDYYYYCIVLCSIRLSFSVIWDTLMVSYGNKLSLFMDLLLVDLVPVNCTVMKLYPFLCKLLIKSSINQSITSFCTEFPLDLLLPKSKVSHSIKNK